VPSHHLTKEQIDLLHRQGCSARDWASVTVSPLCDLARIRGVVFSGSVRIGSTEGVVVVDGVERDCGIYNAAVADCTIGDRVRIANIGTVVSGYEIGDDAVIEHVSSLTAAPHAACGNGIHLDVVNEGGGRSVVLFTDLSAQSAYIQAMMRHDRAFTDSLSRLIEQKISSSASHPAVGAGARILHCGAIRNVEIGPHAYLHGVQLLENGTILSCKEHPTEAGEGVQARSFILAEGATIDGGAMLDKVYAGQGVKLGKQFSAENSVFFANSEGYHGEAVSLFAGPYTVTHHKSTLLIAGLFSFYNAGSGTNQSNHMYKLGPVHQGVFERGCKTGSFSYVFLESRVGAFSVLIGKHYTNLNTPNLPFSYIYEEEGVSRLIPGMALFSVGTVRDGDKWPRRDYRKAVVKRDRIIFDIFSPYTVEKMRRGRDELLALAESTSKEKPFVTYGGTQINRLLLRKGAKYYAMAVVRYLNDLVCTRLAAALEAHGDWAAAAASLASDELLGRPGEWTDIAGLLAPRERVAALEQKIASNGCDSWEAMDAEFTAMHDAYRHDEWRYVCDAFAKDYGFAPASITPERALGAIGEWKKAALSLHAMVLEDAQREFGAFARIGYGIDGTDDMRNNDFTAVRGTSESNAVVQHLVREGEAIEQRYRHFSSTVFTHRKE